jgi:putative flippase GtrA
MIDLFRKPTRSSRAFKFFGVMLILSGLILCNPWSLIMIYLDTLSTLKVTASFFIGVAVAITGTVLTTKNKIR